MPLCPQITNTPITVTQTADFTVTSVVPALADTQDGLANTIDSIEILADGKTKVYRSATAPTGADINDGDLWIDTDDGNKLYVRASGAWVSAQDTSIATAQATANSAASAAATAQSDATTAIANANTAIATANSASSLANTANAAATAAQADATTAINTANSANSLANTANNAAIAAQSTANTALTNAATAYSAAIGSLQPSASTIVNASNQITAIASNGITVYSGASATTGARVVLNSAGLAGFNSSGTATFSISASTGAAVFSGSVTGSTITGGTLNIGGNAIIDSSGFLTATGATITGTITSSNATITGGTLTVGSKFSVTNTGVLTASDAVITGTITATSGTFTGTIISSNATITGGTLTVGTKFSVTNTGVLTASDAVITGNITATSGTFTGVVNATSGTFTGTVNATAGYFGTVTNGWSINSTGLVGVGSGVISGGTISGSTFTNGSTFAVTSTGVLTAQAGTIGGWSLTPSTINKTVGTKTMTLDSSNAILTITDTSTGILTGGGINITSGSVTGTYGAGGLSFAGSVSFSRDSSNNVYIQGGATSAIRLAPGASLGSTTYNVQVEGHLNSIYTLSTGTYSSSSTDLSTGTYLSQTGAMIARRDNQIPIFSHRYNTSGTSEMIRLNYNGSDAGGITTTAGGVPAFRNASDYRLKQNIQDFIGAADIIKQIKLRSFEFIKEPDNKQVGFIAHELAEVLPDLVLGEKDAIDQEGNAEYQSVLATNLIPYLTGAIKELTLRVEQLEGK